jgi:hypothetical protein
MAIRAEALQQDDLLSRYLEASRHHAAPRRPLGTDDLMLARYLRALERYGPPEAVPVADDFRTCTGCGRHARFEGSPGGWAACSACGELA